MNFQLTGQTGKETKERVPLLSWTEERAGLMVPSSLIRRATFFPLIASDFIRSGLAYLAANWRYQIDSSQGRHARESAVSRWQLSY
jgi:hypothetical protein